MHADAPTRVFDVLYPKNHANAIHGIPQTPHHMSSRLKVPRRRTLLILIMPTVRIHRTTHHIAPSLRGHAHLIILLPQRRRETIILMSRLRRRQEIDDEAPDVEDVDERDGPFDDGGAVVVFLVSKDAERYGEGDFDEDEGELDPEGGGEDALVAVVDSESLVFGADEDGGHDVAGTIYQQSVSCPSSPVMIAILT